MDNQLNNPASPPPVPSTRDRLHQLGPALLENFKKNPLIARLLSLIRHFNSRFGYPAKIAILLTFVLFVVLIGLTLGRVLNALFRPPTIAPEALPTLSPTPKVVIRSELRDLKTQVEDFSVLLPDPAPPAVDPNLTLQDKKETL